MRRPHLSTRLFAAVGALALSLLPVNAALAERFGLAQLFESTDAGVVADVDGFAELVADLTTTLRPGLSGPASTLGSLGFELAYARSSSTLSSNAAWKGDTTAPPSSLSISQIIIRKGLPASLELGASFSWLEEQHLWSPTFQFKAALVEGSTRAPDIGVRVRVGGLIGHPEMSLFTAGADLIVSQPFALGGVLRLTPYVSYSLSFGRGSSQPLAFVTPGEVTSTDAVMPAQNSLTHQGSVGIALRLSGIGLGLDFSVGHLTLWTIQAGVLL